MFVYFLFLVYYSFFLCPMINLLDLKELSLKKYIATLLFYTLVNIVMFSTLITQYYVKITEHISVYCNITNVYRKALFYSIIANIPRIYFLIFTDLYGQDTFVNGFTTSYMSLGIGIIIVFTQSKSFVHFESFTKDLFALTGGLLIQSLYINEETYTQVHRNFAAITFAFYFFYTLRLRQLYRRTEPVVLLNMPYWILKKINEYVTRHIYDLLILNLDNLHKQSLYTSVQALISPAINASVFILYFKPLIGPREKIIALFLSLLFGVILMKSSKKQHLQIVNYIYGLLSIMFYTVIFTDRFKILIDSKICNNININYINTVITPLLIGLPELLNLYYHSRKNNSTMAVCSIYNSIIMTSLCFNPIEKLISKRYYLVKYNGNKISISFAAICIAVTNFNYAMKSQKLSKDLGVILMIIYFLFNLTYILDYRKFIVNLKVN